MQLRFGLIGFGEIGKIRARALARSSRCSLAAVFDVDPERRSRATGIAKVFDSAEELLESDACDAVLISTPPDSHADLAIRAMRAGKHVLVEKPMANSLAACDAMLQAAAQTGRVLAVGFNHRYFKGVKRMRRAIAQNEIGPLRFVKAYCGHVGLPELRSPWMVDRAVMGGGTLLDNGIHVLDLIRFIMGEVHSVSAVLPQNIWKLDVEENAFVHLNGAAGVIGSLHASWTAWKGYKFSIEAYGENGMAMMSYAPMFSQVIRVTRGSTFETFKRARERNFYVADIFREKLIGWQATTIDAFAEEFDEFAARLTAPLTGGSAATGFDGKRAIEIANAAYRSAQLERPVELSAVVSAPREREEVAR